MLRALLFDLDDTIFDHRHSSRQALTGLLDSYPEQFSLRDLDAFERYHLAILEEIHHEVLAGTLTIDAARMRRFERILREHNVPFDDTELIEVSERYRQTYIDHMRTVPGARELLEWARERGLKVGIVTNNTVEEQMSKLAQLGLEPLVDEIVISEACGVQKPDPKIFQLALDRLDCRPTEAIMIGDSWKNDILGARAAGISALWYRCYGEPETQDGYSFSSFTPLDVVLELIFSYSELRL